MNSIQTKIRTLKPNEYPYLLRQIDALPDEMYIRGEMPSDDYKFLTIVGSRRFTDYGRAVCESLVASLRGLPVVIISGLAYGIDSIAHESALKHGIKTVAIPGSGIADDMIYPAGHIGLAHRILEAGGAIMSPFPKTVMGNVWTFPFRNRIMAAMAHATLVIEAEIKSGTLITARHASDFNRDLLVVPGSIFEKKSEGPHHFMKIGAVPITCGADLIRALGFDPEKIRGDIDYTNPSLDLSTDEQKILELLAEPMSRDGLFKKLDTEISNMNSLISLLEVKGLVEEKLGKLGRI